MLDRYPHLPAVGVLRGCLPEPESRCIRLRYPRSRACVAPVSLGRMGCPLHVPAARLAACASSRRAEVPAHCGSLRLIPLILKVPGDHRCAMRSAIIRLGIAGREGNRPSENEERTPPCSGGPWAARITPKSPSTVPAPRSLPLCTASSARRVPDCGSRIPSRPSPASSPGPSSPSVPGSSRRWYPGSP